MRSVISVALAIGIVSNTRATGAELPEKIAAAVETARTGWQVPGVAVVVVADTQVIWLGGSGVRELGKPGPATPDTVFPLASCSKAFTTTLMAMLADDAKLDWDDPVRKHLPKFHLSDPLADGDVRLRDLVSHRTGVAGHDLLWYRSAWDQDEQIRRVGLLPLSRPFRAAMQYQTVMFVAAGKAAANSAGQPWEQLVRDRIFKPLEMKSAALSTPEAIKNPDCARPHARQKGTIVGIEAYNISEANPAGSVHVSARDLIGWLQLHLNEGARGETQLVSAANLRATHTPQIPIAMDEANQKMHPFSQQMSYAMGWVVQDYRGELLISHAGIIDGFRAHIAMLPKRKLGLAVLANLDQTRMNLALSNTLVDLLLEAPPNDWNAHYQQLFRAQEFAARMHAAKMERGRKLNTRPTLPLADYVGTYRHPAYGEARISLENGDLYLDWSAFHARLEHFQEDRFRISNDDLGKDLLRFDVSGRSVPALTAIGIRFERE